MIILSAQLLIPFIAMNCPIKDELSKKNPQAVLFCGN